MITFGCNDNENRIIFSSLLSVYKFYSQRFLVTMGSPDSVSKFPIFRLKTAKFILSHFLPTVLHKDKQYHTYTLSHRIDKPMPIFKAEKLIKIIYNVC